MATERYRYLTLPAYHCLDTRRRGVRYHWGINLIYFGSFGLVSTYSDLTSSMIIAQISVGKEESYRDIVSAGVANRSFYFLCWRFLLPLSH